MAGGAELKGHVVGVMVVDYSMPVGVIPTLNSLIFGSLLESLADGFVRAVTVLVPE